MACPALEHRCSAGGWRGHSAGRDSGACGGRGGLASPAQDLPQLVRHEGDSGPPAQGDDAGEGGQVQDAGHEGIDALGTGEAAHPQSHAGGESADEHQCAVGAEDVAGGASVPERRLQHEVERQRRRGPSGPTDAGSDRVAVIQSRHRNTGAGSLARASSRRTCRGHGGSPKPRETLRKLATDAEARRRGDQTASEGGSGALDDVCPSTASADPVTTIAEYEISRRQRQSVQKSSP